MIYAIEAVRLDEQGDIKFVRWHSIEVGSDDLKHGESEVVSIERAAHEAAHGAVHVCHLGAPGSQVVRVVGGHGFTLTDLPTAPENQRLETLERF